METSLAPVGIKLHPHQGLRIAKPECQPGEIVRTSLEATYGTCPATLLLWTGTVTKLLDLTSEMRNFALQTLP